MEILDQIWDSFLLPSWAHDPGSWHAHNVAIHWLITGDMGGDFLICHLSWPGHWTSNSCGIPAADGGDPLPDVSTCWMQWYPRASCYKLSPSVQRRATAPSVPWSVQQLCMEKFRGVNLWMWVLLHSATPAEMVLFDPSHPPSFDMGRQQLCVCLFTVQAALFWPMLGEVTSTETGRITLM